MNPWPTLVEQLRARGWTQALLAERIGIAQSAISDLRRGATTDPKHSTGEAIKALFASGELPPVATELITDQHPAPEGAGAAAAEAARA